MGYQEERSSGLLQEQLTAAGFSVDAGVAGMPTGFIGEWGSDGPVIGILAEFDALPGVSQAAVPEPMEREGVGAGHACGHHLFGTASVAAGLAIKDWLERSGSPGRIRVYGTPAEEGGAGKVYMVRGGLFSDVDAVLAWHPGDRNDASPGDSLANLSAKFRFRGLSAHAAGAPEQGRSALDGVEAMNFMVNLMREHVHERSRIHYVITRGGRGPERRAQLRRGLLLQPAPRGGDGPRQLGADPEDRRRRGARDRHHGRARDHPRALQPAPQRAHRRPCSTRT